MIYERYIGAEVQRVVQEVSRYRIKYFKEFPYLYAGTMEYEAEYFREFATDPNAYVELIRDKGGIVGLATGIPLCSDSDILKDTQELFKKNNKSQTEFFYIGEIIIDETYRNKGLSRILLDNIEQFAREKGFEMLTLATVVRDVNDPRCPLGYKSSDHVWEKQGYKKTSMIFEYHWPTITISGEVEDLLNPMVFWIKGDRNYKK